MSIVEACLIKNVYNILRTILKQAHINATYCDKKLVIVAYVYVMYCVYIWVYLHNSVNHKHQFV